MEKLAAYKKKKEKARTMSGGSVSASESSVSLSAGLLPEGEKEKTVDTDGEQSSISEHIPSSSSVENDRSMQELEIVPSSFSLILKASEDVSNLSQENTPSQNSNGTVTLHSSANKNARSILDEILGNDQFKSERDESYCSGEGSLDIFENINLEDTSINDYLSKRPSADVPRTEDNSEARVRNLMELLGAKDSMIAALNSELDSLKGQSNHSTLSNSFTITEYKQVHEEYASKLAEYKMALAYRDDVIEKLTEQSLERENQLHTECERLTREVENLAKELSETTNFIKSHKCSIDKTEELIDSLEITAIEKATNKDAQNVTLEDICSKLSETLAPSQVLILDELKTQINAYIQRSIADQKNVCDSEVKIIKDKLEQEKSESNQEILRLRELLSSIRCGSTEIDELRKELDSKYVQEMEELRTYYEKKCAEMEKHYSDEVISQQSRKMSGSSTGSEPEFASDLIFGSQPPVLGPGGDPGTPLRSKDFINFLSKSDLLTFKKHLNNFMKVLDKYNVENLSDDDLSKLKGDLSPLDVKGLLKIDLSRLRHDLQSKYNAELEILREDYENQMDELNLQNTMKLKEIEKLNDEQLEGLRYELDEAHRTIQAQANSSIQQEVANSSDYELADIVKSYEVRLQDQIALAKLDIITELENQIRMLAENCSDDSSWPEEFLQIRNKLSEKYQIEMDEQRQSHEEEVTKLKEEHLKALNGALERARRRSLKDESISEVEIIKERNNLKKTSTVLRNLVAELLKYFTQCEDELNNTIVEELVKQASVELDGDEVDHDALIQKRVHFTPNIDELISFVENPSDSKDVSLDFRSELGICLDRLKSDANAVLALSANLRGDKEMQNSDDKVKSLEERINSLTRQMITDSQIKEDLSGQLTEARDFVRNLESTRQELERQSEELITENRILNDELGKARDKIGELIECGRKEIVSEGYGENDKMGLHGGSVSRVTLSELQERARALASKSSVTADNPFLPLVEELCREGDLLLDDAKKQREDYNQQIEAADKKLRATTKFLEEQAMEREQERDEAQREIASLKEQLRERERDRASYERISHEVEQLESQMRDMSRLIDESEKRSAALDAEKKEAVDKIWVLREIIEDFEGQVAVLTKTQSDQQNEALKLKELITQQREVNDELIKRLESGETDLGYREHIERLEEEIRKLRITAELAGDEGVVKQLRLQLTEIEGTIDKATQELETLHTSISLNSVSSQSEEMSIRDRRRSSTPDEESDIPLQQLARLREKLIKHSRAEHAAVKRISDLEMQLVSDKHKFDELQNERDILQDQISAQLVLISSLQMRLDDQRIRTEHVQQQTNASLEIRIYELETEIQNLRDTLHSKESSIKQLNKSLEQTNQLLQKRENELLSSANEDQVTELQAHIERLKSENDMLKIKIESDAQNAQILPGLVDNILADKNRDLDCLRKKLLETEKQLDLYMSMNNDKKGEERGLLSFMNYTGAPEVVRKAESRQDSLELSGNDVPRKLPFSSEISSIEQIGSPNVHYTMEAPLPKPNSTEIQRSSERHVHFDTSGRTDEIKELQEKILKLEEASNKVPELQEELAKMQEEAKKVSELEEQCRLQEEQNAKLSSELADLKITLKTRIQELEDEKLDSNRKDDMYYKLAKEKHDLDKDLKKLEDVKGENDDLKATIDSLKDAFKELEEKDDRLKEHLEKLQHDLKDKNMNNEKLKKEIDNNLKQMENVKTEFESFKTNSENQLLQLNKSLEEESNRCQELQTQILQKDESLKTLTAKLEDRECELEILNEDVTRYQNELVSLENKVKSQSDNSDKLKSAHQRKELAEKDLEIVKLKATIGDLKREIIHLQDYLSEKDKIIDQMKIDADSLKLNLEAIKAKMAEGGNVIDLREKLQQEMQINAQLRSDLGEKNDEGGVDDITEQVRKQLDDSVNLDESILKALSSDEYNEDIEYLRKRIDRERSKNSDLLAHKNELQEQITNLETHLTSSTEIIKQLHLQLEHERQASQEIQIQDGNLLEQLRIKLEEAVENENEFGTILNEEKHKREALESEIAILRLRKSDNSSSVSKTEYKSLPDSETMRMRAEIQLLTEQNEKLKKDFKAAKKAKNEAEVNLKYAKDMLNLKIKEIENMDLAARELREDIILEKEKYLTVKIELDQKIEEAVNTRTFIEELEQERRQMEEEVARVTEKLIKLEEENEVKRAAEAHKNDTVPENFLQKMKDLGDLVSVYLTENKSMAETLMKLSEEKNQLQEKVKELESSNNLKLPYDDHAARTNHLFGKYLRADSYRNALAWQKKYLIRLLASYQEFQPNFPLNKFEARDERYRKSQGIKRFRSAVCVVIAVHRMKYMVLRWHSGTRGHAYNSLQRKFRVANQIPAMPQAQFHVGQPVSSQHFSRPGKLHEPSQVRVAPYEVPRAMTPPNSQDAMPPWSGYTPPSRDRAQRKFEFNSPSTSGYGLQPNHASEIAKCLERFDLIHQRLGMAFGTDSS